MEPCVTSRLLLPSDNYFYPNLGNATFALCGKHMMMAAHQPVGRGIPLQPKAVVKASFA